MIDWQKGDLALCIDDDARGQFKGKIFTVSEVETSPQYIGVGLRFDDLHDDPSGLPWNSNCFRKITPDKADEFDREVIDLMTGQPVGEPA